MKIDLKVILPYIVIIASLAMTWGMWSERLEAVEKKADAVAQMQQAKSIDSQAQTTRRVNVDRFRNVRTRSALNDITATTPS